MKKLLTILILLLTVASKGRAEDNVITLFSGEKVIDYGDNVVQCTGNNLKKAEIGSVITIDGQISDTNDYHIKLTKNQNWAALFEYNSDLTLPIKYTVTNETVKDIKQGGIKIEGKNITITNITMTVPYEFTMWEGNKTLNWSINIDDLVGESFDNFEIGSQIVVTGTQESGQLKLCNKEPWEDIEYISSGLVLPYTYTIPYEYVEKIKNSGIQFQGTGVAITKIEKKESNVIWLATTEELNNVNIVSRKLENIAIGNRLKITKTNKESSDGTLSVSYNNGTENVVVCSMQSWDGGKEIEVTSTNIDYIKQNGLYLTGSNLAESKIELDTSDPEAVSSIDPEKFVKLWNTTSNTPAQSITFSSTWGGAGWNIGDDKYNEAQSITVVLSAAPTTPLNLVLEYVTTDGAVLTNTSNYGNSTDGFTASSTVSVPQSDLLKIRKLYIQNPDATTTITLSSVKIATSVLNNDMSVYEVASSVFSSALVGDKIKITYSSISSGDMTLQVGTTDGGTDLLASTTVTGTTQEIDITAGNLSDITTNGLYFRGSNIRITNVEIASTKTEKTLVAANVDCRNLDGEGATAAIPGYKFKNAVDGDKLVVHVSEVGEAAYISAKHPVGNYPSILGETYSTAVGGGENECQISLTADIIASLKAKGLIICGKNLTIGVVALYTESALGTESDTRTFTYNISPEGSGTVEVRIGGTDGEITTATSFLQGTQLTVTAKPNNGYQFVKWKLSNDDDDTTNATFVCTLEDNIQKTAVFESTPVFDANGKADLSKFEVQDADKVTYDGDLHKITVTEGWTGVQLNATTADDVQGKELRITFSEAAKVKATVKYADETATDTIMSDASAILYMVINGTKKVSQIQIQPTDAGSITRGEGECREHQACRSCYYSRLY